MCYNSFRIHPLITDSSSLKAQVKFSSLLSQSSESLLTLTDSINEELTFNVCSSRVHPNISMKSIISSSVNNEFSPKNQMLRVLLYKFINVVRFDCL